MSGIGAWQAGRLSPGGQAVHNKLTGRGVLMTAPQPQPQPKPAVVAELTNPDLAPASLAEQVNALTQDVSALKAEHAALTAQHADGHPHMTGSVQPAFNPAEHFPLPNNVHDEP